jgi:hypothetical protein
MQAACHLNLGLKPMKGFDNRPRRFHTLHFSLLVRRNWLLAAFATAQLSLFLYKNLFNIRHTIHIGAITSRKEQNFSSTVDTTQFCKIRVPSFVGAEAF